MKKWIVTGGAGYIGSHIALEMAKLDFDVIVIDNLSKGLESRLKGQKNIRFVNSNILDLTSLKNIFQQNGEITGVIHMAALKSVEESMFKRKLYFENNVIGLRNVLECARVYKIKNFIFSSSAAVYGQIDHQIKNFSEHDLCKPNSVYGENKLIGELLVRDYSMEFNMNSVSLRYFNVIGSGKRGLVDHSKDNLLPKLIKAFMENKSFAIFGKDYETHDGTCIRDYVDVRDLVNGHIKAATYLQGVNPGQINQVVNLGSGRGYSVLEVVSEFKRQIGGNLAIKFDSRRSGDPAYLVADISYARKLFNWSPEKSLVDMISSSLINLNSKPLRT